MGPSAESAASVWSGLDWTPVRLDWTQVRPGVRPKVSAPDVCCCVNFLSDVIEVVHEGSLGLQTAMIKC